MGASTRVARCVDVATNSFTDEVLSVEQMIPISGRNRSRERIAAAEALSALEDKMPDGTLMSSPGPRRLLSARKGL